MNTQEQDRQDARLRVMLTAAFPTEEPSDALKRRLQQESAQQTERSLRRVRRRQHLRLGLVYAGLAALVAAAIIVRPRIVAAQELARMQSAINDARSAHTVEWRVKADGERVKQSETWFQDGRWRVESWRSDSDKGPDVEICADGGHWYYNAFKNTATYDRQPQPTGFQFMSGFSLGASVKDAALVGVLMDVREEGTTVTNGRTVRHVIVRDNKYPADRNLILVDAQTDLPLGGQSQSEQNGRWVTKSVGEEHYNQALSAELFRPAFPKTARVIDREAERRVWERRLAKGVAEKKISDTSLIYPLRRVNGRLLRVIEEAHQPRMVVVRDFQVNRSGDAFLLFTAGDSIDRAGQFGSVELTDDLGTEYIPQSNPLEIGTSQFIATCWDGDGKGGSVQNGYLFNGEPLEGTWWVPVEPARTPWKPRRFMLTFHLEGPVSPGQDTLSLTVQKPEADIAPDYMPYMARGLFDVSVQTDEALRRAYYYQARHDLPEALFWYQQTIAVMRTDDLKTGYHYDASIEWFAVYQILTRLGRISEAKQALLHADEDAVYVSPTRDQIRAAMEKTGLSP